MLQRYFEGSLRVLRIGLCQRQKSICTILLVEAGRRRPLLTPHSWHEHAVIQTCARLSPRCIVEDEVYKRRGCKCRRDRARARERELARET